MFAWPSRRMRYQDPTPHCQQRTCKNISKNSRWIGNNLVSFKQEGKHLFTPQVYITALSRTNPTKLNGSSIEIDVPIDLRLDQGFVT